MMPAREGVQTEAAAWKSVKRTPPAASASSRGVSAGEPERGREDDTRARHRQEVGHTVGSGTMSQGSRIRGSGSNIKDQGWIKDQDQGSRRRPARAV